MSAHWNVWKDIVGESIAVIFALVGGVLMWMARRIRKDETERVSKMIADAITEHEKREEAIYRTIREDYLAHDAKLDALMRDVSKIAGYVEGLAKRGGS